ncbi:MAG: hypothetical protein CML16_11135 [Pusillimonas sp.]|nr:hypothetical protein [Pusillimonas sp.]MBC40668.1 hypothetical protein [Pusillimonas sp.]HCP77735.1 hypothetical protein [Pusillimonas sp.]|tara:strand:- start:392 stop:625 length:234 start_codon:yes stop_codon:yes gene_type:complete
MNTHTSFDSWLESEIEKGLVDIKFAISPGKGVSSAAIHGELLQAEASLQFGNLGKEPTPVSEIPDSIAQLFKKVTFH